MYKAQYIDHEISVFEIEEDGQMIVRYISNEADNGELVLTNLNHLEKEDEETLCWLSLKPHYVSMVFVH